MRSTMSQRWSWSWKGPTTNRGADASAYPMVFPFGTWNIWPRRERTVAKLSDKRRMAIYSAVHERLMTLRINLAKHRELMGAKLGTEVDYLVAQAMDDAAAAAVRAAENGANK